MNDPSDQPHGDVEPQARQGTEDADEVTVRVEGSSDKTARETRPGSEGSAPRPDLLEETRRELEEQRRKLDEMARAYSGVVNDQKDFRSRLQREKERVLETERGNVALALIETVDELDRALAAAAKDEGPLAQGVRLIRDGIMKRLTALGIERLSLTGKSYDPGVAEVIDLVPVTDEAQGDLVIDELAAAYKLGNRVLRPARVRVGRFVPRAPGNGGAGPQIPN